MKRTLLALCLVGCGHAATETPPPDDGAPHFEVEVGSSGYSPSEIHAPAGRAIHLGFLRTSDEGCGGELVIPSMDVHRDLPLNQRVWIDVTTPASGRLAFTCGMGMYQGAVVVD